MRISSSHVEQFSLEQSFKYCSAFTRKRSWKLWLMTQIMMNYENRGYIYLCHTYFRWLDDYIDDINRSVHDKKIFIQKQIELFEQLVQQKQIKLKSNEEVFLFYVLKYAANNNNQLLINTMRNLMEGMMWDVNRWGGVIIFSDAQLKKYIAMQSQTFSTIVNIFLKKDFTDRFKDVYVGEFYWYILTLRDFKDDVVAGYINISCEDLLKFNLNQHDLLNDNKRFLWMKFKYLHILQLLENEKNLLKTYPLKLKLFWVPGYVSLLVELVRIKEYDYRFGVIIKRKLLRELKLMIEALTIFMKFSAAVFSSFKKNQISSKKFKSVP